MSVTESQVKKAIALILNTSLVIIGAICKTDSRLAQAEAKHVHHLPQMLYSFSIPDLRYYANVERPDYLRSVGNDHGKIHEENWKSIDAFLKEN